MRTGERTRSLGAERPEGVGRGLGEQVFWVRVSPALSPQAAPLRLWAPWWLLAVAPPHSS